MSRNENDHKAHDISKNNEGIIKCKAQLDKEVLWQASFGATKISEGLR